MSKHHCYCICLYSNSSNCLRKSRSLSFGEVSRIAVLKTYDAGFRLIIKLSKLFLGECERQLKFPCKYSIVCGVAGSKFLCNKTKHLCIDINDVCNDVNDCLEGDNSDESRCKKFRY